MTKIAFFALAASLLGFLTLAPSGHTQTPVPDGWTAQAALARFAADYEKDPAALAPLAFGIEVDGTFWTVKTAHINERMKATLSRAPLGTPGFYFKTDRETLARMDTGTLHGLTALGQTRATDPAPMTLEFTDGFSPEDPAAFQRTFLSVAFHFWTREQPETVRLDPAAARVLHGAKSVAIYYDPALHTAWYHVEPGRHVNADPRDQRNDHPSLFVVTKGEGKARLGGKERVIKAGEALYVAAGVPHEFWNPGDAPFEFVLMMWGFP